MKRLSSEREALKKKCGEIFASRLEKAMCAKGCDIKYLAAKTGMTQKRIQAWLVKRICPDVKALVKLAEILEYSCDYFLGRKDF